MNTSDSAWQKKQSVKKGNVGEALIDEFLLANNIIPYSPVGDQSHDFDRVCVSKKTGDWVVVEVKTKRRRDNWDDTGVDIPIYERYAAVQKDQGVKIYIFFVDDLLKKVYGNWLDELMKPVQIEKGRKTYYWPLKWEGIMYFHLDNMIDAFDLTDQVVEKLNRLSNRSANYKYEEIT